ncbi:MAG: FMN-binding protein [Paludibacteraceae bacterium]|nr:FMN-binding protein [Paludibacteraceae bacterium]
MAKLESSLKNMLLSLTCITLVAAVALAGIYTLTKDRIDAQKTAAEQEARLSVLAGHSDGTPIMTETDGFGGKMKVMFGFAPDGTILGYKVLEHSETPGLGDKAVWWFQDKDKPGQNIVGRVANGTFSVSKDGGDVDAITAATISSRAFLKAANEAYNEFRSMEAATGATKPVATEDAEEEDDDEVETNEETEAQDE